MLCVAPLARCWTAFCCHDNKVESVNLNLVLCIFSFMTNTHVIAQMFLSHLSTCGGRLPADPGSPAPGRSPRHKRLRPQRDPAAPPSSSPPSTPGGPARGPPDQTDLELHWSGAYCTERRRRRRRTVRQEVRGLICCRESRTLGNGLQWKGLVGLWVSLRLSEAPPTDGGEAQPGGATTWGCGTVSMWKWMLGLAQSTEKFSSERHGQKTGVHFLIFVLNGGRWGNTKWGVVLLLNDHGLHYVTFVQHKTEQAPTQQSRAWPCARSSRPQVETSRCGFGWVTVTSTCLLCGIFTVWPLDFHMSQSK